MSKNSNFRIIMRWIAIIPAAVLAYALAKGLSDWSASRFFYELVRDVNTNRGIGGHYIFGSIYIFQRELVATLGAFYFSLVVAPKYRQYVYFIMAVLYIFGILVIVSILNGYIATAGLYNWTSENTIRTIIETAAQIIAIIVIGVTLLKGELFANTIESKHTKQNNLFESDEIMETLEKKTNAVEQFIPLTLALTDFFFGEKMVKINTFTFAGGVDREFPFCYTMDKEELSDFIFQAEDWEKTLKMNEARGATEITPAGKMIDPNISSMPLWSRLIAGNSGDVVSLRTKPLIIKDIILETKIERDENSNAIITIVNFYKTQE